MMNAMETTIANKIKEIIAELLGVNYDQVSLNSRFRDDLEADSLDLVELIMAFEDEFDGEISDEVAVKMITVGDVVTYIKKQISSP